MGSVVHYSRLQAFDEKFGEKVLNHYKYLIGHSITAMSEFQFDYHKKADITLDNGEGFEVHFEWTMENGMEEEILNSDELTSIEYFNSYLKANKITGIDVGYDRDDEYYVYLIVEDGDTLEVPIGFNAYEFELYDDSIISKEEFKEFVEQIR